MLGGLLGDLREQVHAWDIEGRRLPKPLLWVIDEAGQLELSWLPAEVSTIAGLGAMLVTCWQSKALISDRYGNLADAVLGGHRSKVFFSGVDDPSTVDYLSKVAGTEHATWVGAQFWIDELSRRRTERVLDRIAAAGVEEAEHAAEIVRLTAGAAAENAKTASLNQETRDMTRTMTRLTVIGVLVAAAALVVSVVALRQSDDAKADGEPTTTTSAPDGRQP